MRYLTMVRLSHAAGQLASSRFSLDEIAVMAGYASDASLSKAFKREYGQAPGAYRANARRPPSISAVKTSPAAASAKASRLTS